MSIKEQYGAYLNLYFPETVLMILERTMPDQQKLMEKGRGHLIYVSNFVKKDNG